MKTSALFILMLLSLGSLAQLSPESEHYKMIMANDSLLFELSFNKCQTQVLQGLISEDFEFYHDQGGITKGKSEFIASIDKNICNFPGRKSRRELVEGSTRIFPMANNGELYGLLQKGQHKFFYSINGGPEQKGAIALFTHLWIKEGNDWKLQRSLSYDHKPQPSNVEITKAEIDLNPYIGHYKAPQTGNIHISIIDDNLFLKATGLEAPLQYKGDNRFEIPDTPLEFQFVTNADMQVEKFKVVENGKVVEEAKKQ